jgi:hypothetical protein
MVLIVSASSNTSSQVRREAERAAHRDIPSLPFRTEDVALSGELESFLSESHWLDAITPPPDQHLQLLVRAVLRVFALAGRRVSASRT